MRAAVLQAVGDEELEIVDDVSLGNPGPGEVRVRIGASGVCHSDLSAMDGTIPTPAPAVLGHEGSGEVQAVGDGVAALAPGDRVIISWSPPCGECADCLRGQSNLCGVVSLNSSGRSHFKRGDQDIFSFAGTGTFAEEIVVPAAAAIKIPADVPYDVAALIGCGVMTGVGAAINTARVRPGSSVVVFGCGGVGISVIQGARIAGAAEIVAVDLLESKLEAARRFGATHVATPDTLGDVSAEVTGGAGFDYAFEVIGSAATIRAAFDNARRGGTAVVVGVGRMEEMVSFSALELFYMEKNLKGSLYGSANVRTDFHRLLRLWRTGRLDLEGMISARCDLAGVNGAISALKAGDVIRTVIEFS
ncbi:MAG: alcohol dehydrogenase catalytic domain-containing protein [Acidimicrobiales bacterium]